MWTKICGNTNLEDAQLAAEAGADAVGFVFAASPRRVTAAQVSRITPHLAGKLEKYGVFVDADTAGFAPGPVSLVVTGGLWGCDGGRHGRNGP